MQKQTQFLIFYEFLLLRLSESLISRGCSRKLEVLHSDFVEIAQWILMKLQNLNRMYLNFPSVWAHFANLIQKSNQNSFFWQQRTVFQYLTI